MKVKMKKTGSLILVLMILVGATACAGGEEAASAAAEQAESAGTEETPGGKVLVYLSGPEAMIEKLEQAFEQDRGDVCDFVIMSCGQLRSKVWTEHEAGEIQADVIWGSDPLIYNKLDDEDAFAAVELDAEQIAPEYLVEERDYALVNERYVTIICHSDLVNEMPESYADLADSAYLEQVVMADANQSSTAFAIASSLYQLEGNGPGYFQSLKANGIRLVKANGMVPSSIMEGQFALGIGPHDSVFRLKQKGKKEGFEVPLSVVWPSEGVIAIQRPIAVVKDEGRAEEEQRIAEDLVRFLLSKPAQEITVKSGFVSVRDDIENIFLPDGAEVYRVDWEQANEREELVKQSFQEVFHN